MVWKCVVPGCEISKRKNPRISGFTIPKNEETLRKWEQLLSCNLRKCSTSSLVCEKHFNEDDVEKSDYKVVYNGVVIASAPRQRARLRNGALPSLKVDQSINCNIVKKELDSTNEVDSSKLADTLNYTDDSIKSVRICEVYSLSLTETSKENNVIRENNCIELGGTSEVCNPNLTDTPKRTDFPKEWTNQLAVRNFNDDHKFYTPFSKAERLHKHNNNNNNKYYDTNNEENAYLTLIKNVANRVWNIKLPNGKWSVYINEEKNRVIYAYWDYLENPSNESSKPAAAKIVQLRYQEVEVWVRDKNLKLHFHEKPGSSEELVTLLKKIDKCTVCSGGPPVSQYPDSFSKVGYKDGEVWRHNDCPIVLEEGMYCNMCIKLHRKFDTNNDEKEYLTLIKNVANRVWNIELPNGKWSVYINEEKNRVIYTCWDYLENPTNESLKPTASKIVQLRYQEVKAWVSNKDLKLHFHEKPCSPEELITLLKKIDKCTVCSGGPPVSQYPDSYSKVGYKDGEVWRHEDCPIVLEERMYCNMCIKLYRNFYLSSSRNSTRKRRRPAALTPSGKNEEALDSAPKE